MPRRQNPSAGFPGTCARSAPARPGPARLHRASRSPGLALAELGALALEEADAGTPRP